jgi:peroxiredoxin Q/BCP
LQAFENNLDKFESLNTQVLGVSGDSLDTHKKFTKKYDIGFPLVSDENGAVRDLYGGGRTTFLIDMNGVIRYIQSGVPDNKVFLKKIKALEKKY